jgi:tRNA A22 N-methylase
MEAVFNIWLDEEGIIFDLMTTKLLTLLKMGTNKMINSVVEQPEESDYEISRFLAKFALELLTHRIQNENEWIDEIVNKVELDPLRNYARYGQGEFWKYHQRRIYSEETRFTDAVHHPEPYEIS